MADFVFPTDPVEPDNNLDPPFLILFSHPGRGKTKAVSMLPNNLLIDLENRSKGVGGLKLAANNWKELKQIMVEFKKQQVMYDFVTLDSATALFDIVLELAGERYRLTLRGSRLDEQEVNKEGKKVDKPGKHNILDLPNGAGYPIFRKAYKDVINKLSFYARQGIILTGHIKEKFIKQDVSALDPNMIDIPGKLGTIIMSSANAIGFAYRNKNKFMVTFASDDIVVKADVPHLRSEPIVLTEYNPTKNTFQSHWDLIYPSYFKQLQEGINGTKT